MFSFAQASYTHEHLLTRTSQRKTRITMQYLPRWSKYDYKNITQEFQQYYLHILI